MSTTWGKDTRKKLLDEDDEFGEPPIAIENGFAKVIVVDNLPIVTADKYEKLKTVVSKIFGSLGTVVQLDLPQDESKSTKGYAFIEFATADQAQTAIEKADGYKLEKQRMLKVTPFDDFAKYLSVPDTYTVPEVPQVEPMENLRWWLLNERGLDQYSVRYGDVTEVLWNDLRPGETPESVIRRESWTESYVKWSPFGSYLATMFPEGVAVWGGPNWTKLARFPHPGVKLVDFSPNENYLVTASPQFQENDNPKDPQCIIVWEVRTATKLRGFLGNVGGSTDASWPIFKWSHDDLYLARLVDDCISVYQTPSMDLLDKKSLKIPGVKDFAWSPTEHLMSYFVPESQNKPASVVLIELPSRREKRTKNLFSVVDCKMHWQSSGEFLALKVDRHTKPKKTTYTDFELFRIREKDIPIDHFEIKENVMTFQWEPKGYRMAIIHGEAPRPDISFYTMENKFRHLKTLEKKPTNNLYWSPQGSFIVLAGLGALNGVFEFYNVNDMESMSTEEHFAANQVEWDPTGRYFATVVSYWKHQVENGYNIYSFQGKLLKHVLKEKFYQLLWRPRPPPLLSAERINYIKKNINVFAKQMKIDDKLIDDQERAKKRAKKLQLRSQFESFLAQREKEYQSEAALRKDLGIPDDDDESEYEIREQWVEKIEYLKETVINED